MRPEIERSARRQPDGSRAAGLVSPATPPTITPSTGLLGYTEAANYLATSERHVRQLWQMRKITGVKVGRLVKFRRADLDAFIEAHTIEAVG